MCESDLSRHAGITSSTAAPSALTTARLDPNVYVAGQAIVCYLRAAANQCKLPQMQLARVLALLAQDSTGSGVLSAITNQYSDTVPTWFWVMWIPQLLAGLSRPDTSCHRKILQRIALEFPQALYCTLRAWVLERKEAAGIASGSSVSSSAHRSDVPESTSAAVTGAHGLRYMFHVCLQSFYIVMCLLALFA